MRLLTLACAAMLGGLLATACRAETPAVTNLEKATKVMFTALSMISMHIRIMMAFLFASTP